MKNIDIKNAITITTLVMTGLFWFFTIHGLPKRVEAIEGSVKTLQLEERAVKTTLELIYNDVQFIKGHLMNKKNKE